MTLPINRQAVMLVLVALLAIPSSVVGQDLPASLVREIDAVLSDKRERTHAELKMASGLVYLVREVAGRPAVAGAPLLKSRIQLDSEGRVAVEISAQPSESLKHAIESMGGRVIFESARFASVTAHVPARFLLALAGRKDVVRISRLPDPIAHTGSVTSEGDAAHRASATRTSRGVSGANIRVGVISDSADFSANAIALGDLPASFSILPGFGSSGTGEGTAMSEIVHDLAPGAEIVFASANGGRAAFASAILGLDAAGCNIIVDDISYPNEWQFQDGVIAQAVNTVVGNGRLYLSSSGNEGSLKHGNSTTWEGDFADAGPVGAPITGGGRIHRFGLQSFNRLMSGTSDATLQWSDEYNTSANDYDLLILNAAGTSVVSASTNSQNGADVPYEEVPLVSAGERIVAIKFSGADRYLRLSCTGSAIEVQTAGQTIGHASTPNCITVASSDAYVAFPNAFTTSSQVETASSDGPRKLFHRADGTPFTPGNFLSSGGLNVPSPDLTAADGVVTSLPAGGLNPFYGTSAAAPHAAAIAALVWSYRPHFTNAQVRAILEWSCLDIEDPGYDINSGHGILMADLALERTAWTSESFGCATPAVGFAAPSLTVTGGVSRLGTTMEITALDPSPTATATLLGVHVYASPSTGPRSSVVLSGVCYNLSLTMIEPFLTIPNPSVFSLPLPSDPALDGTVIEAQIASADSMSSSGLIPVNSSRGISIRLSR